MRAILGLVLTVLGTSVAAEPSLITIRGLTVDSTPEEVKSLLGGECRAFPDSKPEDNGFACGPTQYSGYTLTDEGKIDMIMLHCSVVNGCSYSDPELASMIAEGLSLPSPAESYDTHEIIGPAGDLILLTDIEAETYVVLAAGNYRKPQLKLD